MKTAIVLGATGMVGKALVNMLLQDERFDIVRIFIRRNIPLEHEKLEKHIVDFNKPEGWREYVKGDILFSTMGTTLKTAGSKEAQYTVDYTYQYQMAAIAAAQGIHTYVLVSAAGADAASRIFYTRMKGELEDAVKKLPFKDIHIVRPGILEGKREEKRTGEKIGIVVMKVIGLIPGLGKLKPVHDATVAKAMINASMLPGNGIRSYTLGAVFEIAK